MPPVRGSGSHPCKRIALSRALTEAAQGRLTRISGSRDDLSNSAFDDAMARRMAAEAQVILQHPAKASFADMPNAEHSGVEEDVSWICAALQERGLRPPAGYGLLRRLWWWFDFIILVKIARLRFIAILVAVGGVIDYEMAEYNAAIKFKANATVFSQNAVVAKVFTLSFAKKFF